ncbi:hypothetical protein M501DRAFT_575967 [Patellaria atrata CBS 101060]|uniref:Uncharacterized protein n=1 Tax=Patellaria atrata CBS 101060 TaxID=1346257 RepID=A0A9P4SFG8_9PEZI|nr:hypothetical protein M501DRAFT_575967 [Patellaria atrata CBS 101060]
MDVVGDASGNDSITTPTTTLISSTLNVLLLILSSVSYYILYVPLRFIALILYAVLSSILKGVWSIVYFILLPGIVIVEWLGRMAGWVGAFVARFETLYIYLGIASLIGAAFGLLLYYLSTLLTSTLNLEGSSSLTGYENGRTIKAYREQRRRKKLQESGLDRLKLHAIRTGRVDPEYLETRERGQMEETIMEEEDSEF